MYENTVAVHCLLIPAVNMPQASFLENVARTRARKHFLTQPNASELLAMSLHPSFPLVHGAVLNCIIRLITFPDLRKSVLQVSGKASLSVKQRLVDDFVCFKARPKLHETSIASHTCISCISDLDFKPHFIIPSCTLPSSPSTRPGGMREAVE